MGSFLVLNTAIIAGRAAASESPEKRHEMTSVRLDAIYSPDIKGEQLRFRVNVRGVKRGVKE